jgi:hypothetical protein
MITIFVILAVLLVFAPILGPIARAAFLTAVIWVCVFPNFYDGGTVKSETVSSQKTQHVLSVEELENYPYNCNKKESQLAELRALQKVKNFDPDPDKLNEWDRYYNGRLKSTIWWYTYHCEQS